MRSDPRLRSGFLNIGFQIVDILIILIASIAVYFFLFNKIDMGLTYLLSILILILLSFNTFNAFGVYKAKRGQALSNEVSTLTAAWLTISAIVSSVAYFSKTADDFSRLWVGWSLLVSYILIITSRVIGRHSLKAFRKKGFNVKNIAIVGASEIGRQAVLSLKNSPESGLNPIAFFDDKPKHANKTYHCVPVVGTTHELHAFIEDCRLRGEEVHQVWLALPLRQAERIDELQKELEDTATSVYVVPDFFGFKLASYQVDYVAGMPIMHMSTPSIGGFSGAVKRLMDVSAALLALVVLSPLFVITALIIKFESKGPVFFKQRRYGQDGRIILVWKFRSMTVTEDSEVVTQATKNDTRVTKIGAVIRKLSIDELPQLINVLIGNMSLVGPRPHAVAHNEYYRKKVKGYMVRHQIKPGITGLAQVNGCRGETREVADMEKRVKYDLEYIRNWSVMLDVWIILKTVGTLFNTKNTY